jgi:hypothetical protein
VKVKIDCDEQSPVFSFSNLGTEVELTDDVVARIKAAQEEWEACQSIHARCDWLRMLSFTIPLVCEHRPAAGLRRLFLESRDTCVGFLRIRVRPPLLKAVSSLILKPLRGQRRYDITFWEDLVGELC